MTLTKQSDCGASARYWLLHATAIHTLTCVQPIRKMGRKFFFFFFSKSLNVLTSIKSRVSKVCHDGGRKACGGSQGGLRHTPDATRWPRHVTTRVWLRLCRMTRGGKHHCRVVVHAFSTHPIARFAVHTRTRTHNTIRPTPSSLHLTSTNKR
jgi:hypothetical protein